MSALGPWTYEPGFGWTRRTATRALGAWVNSVNRWAVWLANGPSNGGSASTAKEGKEKADAYITASAGGAPPASEEEQRSAAQRNSVMLYTEDSKNAVRCPNCGSNVFQWIDKAAGRVSCNGCGDRFVAEMAS